MYINGTIKPDFIIIGAQKAGTTWLWERLKAHPETDLPEEKEIHYFGGVERYRNGTDWYYDHFRRLNPEKITGEASTTYFYDHMPYWYNDAKEIEFDRALAPIPALITRELPHIKIIVVLRDPVKRALSAHRHWLRVLGGDGPSPMLGLKRYALENPKFRILEYGLYGKYIAKWQEHLAQDKCLTMVFEEDIRKTPEITLKRVYRFLGIDPEFSPENLEKPIHKSWNISKSIINWRTQRAKTIAGRYFFRQAGRLVTRKDLLKPLAVKKQDIAFLKAYYRDDVEKLKQLIDADFSAWT